MKANEIITEYKDVSQDADDGHANMTGYVVDTDEEQLTNYFVTEYGIPEQIIQHIRDKYNTIAIGRNMYVDEDHRGQGHGTELMQSFMEEAFDNGAEAILIIADTAESNEFDLVEWYKGWGFEPVEQTGAGPLMVYEYES